MALARYVHGHAQREVCAVSSAGSRAHGVSSHGGPRPTRPCRRCGLAGCGAGGGGGGAQTVAPDTVALFLLVEDTDLWRHALPDSRLAMEGLRARRLEYDVAQNPSVFDQLASLEVAALCAEGRLAITRTSAVVARALDSAVRLDIRGPHGMTLVCLGAVVEAADVVHTSAIGHELARVSRQRLGPAASAVGAVLSHFTLGPGPHAPRDVADAVWKVSLRAAHREGADAFDTTAVSEHYGGGGHRAASGFQVSRSTLDTFVVQSEVPKGTAGDAVYSHDQMPGTSGTSS